MNEPQTGPSARPAEWRDGLPECTECGFCCFFDDPRYVMLFDGDLERLGTRAEELTVWIAGRVFMRSDAGHCIALKQDGERWLCSIYEQRPFLCRDFQRGCDTCHAVVRDKHPRALPVVTG